MRLPVCIAPTVGPVYAVGAFDPTAGCSCLSAAGSLRTIRLAMSGTEFKSTLASRSIQRDNALGGQPALAVALTVTAIITTARMVVIRVLIRASPAWTTDQKLIFAEHQPYVHTVGDRERRCWRS
jgi:hypothetical protein